LLIGVFLCLQN